MDGGFGGLDGIMLVVNGGCGASKIVNLVNLDIEREANIVAHQLESGVSDQMFYVTPCARKEVVDTEYFVPAIEQALHKVRAEKSSSTGHQNSRVHVSLPHRLCRHLPEKDVRVKSLHNDLALRFFADFGPGQAMTFDWSKHF
jgi:hypothetical protein